MHLSAKPLDWMVMRQGRTIVGCQKNYLMPAPREFPKDPV